jgi:hypothetical protein
MKTNPETSRKITTHEDLMAERKRLEMSVAIHKALLIREADNVKQEVKERLQPATNFLDTLRQIRSILSSAPVLAGIALLGVTRMIKRSSKQTSTTPVLSIFIQSLLTNLGQKQRQR